MTSCHSEHSIPRLLHYIVTLLIAKIVPNYEFKLEILILVVLSYCGISNMVSRRLLFYLFISKYSFACYLFVFRFFFFYQLLSNYHMHVFQLLGTICSKLRLLCWTYFLYRPGVRSLQLIVYFHQGTSSQILIINDNYYYQ